MVHPGAVALILAEIGCDKDSVIAALLHDTIEDTKINPDDIKEIFGEAVYTSVDTVTNITGIDQKYIRGLSLSKLFQAFNKDQRSILIKLADRLHNMRTVSGLSDKKQKNFARETLDIFVPLARIAQMEDWADEMSDIAASILWPQSNFCPPDFLLFSAHSDPEYQTQPRPGH